MTNPSAAHWSLLTEELARWQDTGGIATLWWRDDDAVDDSPALRRLLEVAQVPVALAVIPEGMRPGLPKVIDGTADNQRISVLQHGFGHHNHEPIGRKKAELGAGRPADRVLADLRQGHDRLQAAFGARFLPVLTPPWNRIAPPVVSQLPQMGLHGLTTYLPRRVALPVPGLLQVNTHVDIIDWHNGRGFLGTEPSLDLLIGHLRARRLGEVDTAEPTGLLTHHLVQDAASWAFLARLQDWLSASPVIRWLRAEDVWGDKVFAAAMERKTE